MPDTTTVRSGSRSSSAKARYAAARTPKSPQPGHQIGLRSDLYDLASRTVLLLALGSRSGGRWYCLLDEVCDLDRRERAAGDLVLGDHLDATVCANHARELAGVVDLWNDDRLHTLSPLLDPSDRHRREDAGVESRCADA